ncbi:alpha-tocopherol transfer protein-like [Lineus longissimus]|uniref:alpha-tocopherol transfer protein-like n=1 Tax=Lineus longissimus TaxID=88925 RepID=UPI00315CDE51
MAELPGEGTYVCTLDEETQKKAKDELKEDPKERASKIQNVRDWIKKHPYITSRTDDAFILRFLRSCKSSVFDTQNRIKQFCINRTTSEGAPEWFKQDVDDQKIIDILSKPTQILLPKPKGKKDGPVYILSLSKNMDPYIDINDTMRALYMTVDTMVMDENVQVHGMYYIQDMKGAGMDMMKIWNQENIKKSMKVWKDVYPTRMKQFHYVNMPRFLNAIMEIIKPFMGKKLSDRMKIHHSEKEFAKKIPKECLPNEYGGTAGTIEEIYAPFREKVLNNRQEYELLKQCWADEEKMPKEVPAGDAWGMVGSFRKIETD